MPGDDYLCSPNFAVRTLASILVRLGCVQEQDYLQKGWLDFAENLQFKWLKLRLSVLSPAKRKAFIKAINDDRAMRAYHKISSLWVPATPGGTTFKHSGNLGDVIYALPTLRALSQGKPATLFLNLDAPINEWLEKEHPTGKSGLTAGTAKFLKPLLEYQPGPLSVRIYQNEPVDYDLDLFRKIPGGLTRGHIAHWYFWAFPVSANLSAPWLQCPQPAVPGRKIVLARSSRYRNPGLDYAFLRKWGEIDFIGVPSEFEEMRKILPQLRQVECADALQLASVIQSARFFIGNESFPFSVAEALKVRRILEVSPAPVVIPAGGHFGDAFFQANFEALVERFWQETAG